MTNTGKEDIALRNSRIENSTTQIVSLPKIFCEKMEILPKTVLLLKMKLIEGQKDIYKIEIMKESDYSKLKGGV